MNNVETVKKPEGNIIETKGLEKHFRSGGNEVKAVDGVTIGLPRGKMIALRGSSGSGKTTLLNLIGALDRPSAGSIVVDGVDVSKVNGNAEVKYRLLKVGFVFQAYCLIPNLSALENAMMPIELLNPKDKQRVEKAQKLLERVGIDPIRQARRPAKLSGGEQQRVAIARALANDPPIILADEPTGNLDSKNGKRIVELLRSLTKDGKTVLIATHDADIAASADIKIEMVDGKIMSINN
ncbi:MAG: ABC transporter ATP-binding protein [Dehalococcoidales bacterium]